MTVLDNIKLGAHVHLKSGFLSGGVYFGKTRQEETALRKHIEEKIIDLLEIEQIRKKVVHALPYGLQKRVEMARALAMNPRVLLLDEPATGMNLEETEDIARFILDINEEWGVTIILIEHDMGMVMDISDRVCRWMLAQFEVYLVFGCLQSDDSRAELLAELRSGAQRQNPVERRYAQQVLRFAEKIQYDLYYKEVRSLVAQISLIEEFSMTTGD
jgi:energy-coupling factor transporter ATP-binding protein EcfA2